jgi:hypothetical protein
MRNLISNFDRTPIDTEFENTSTVKPLYVEHIDNWFLKLVLYYLNKYIFKNHLSTYLHIQDKQV